MKIHPVLDRGGQFHRHVRAFPLPLQQTRQQPAHDAGRCLELQGFTLLADLFNGLVDQAENLLHPRQPFPSFGCQVQASGLTDEQFITQKIFQTGDLPTHRALGDKQLFGGPGEIAALRGNQKSVQRRQGRQSFHWDPRYDVRTWLV
ncbi:hypothetical protein D9M69_468560 [compost metagenome]